MPTPRVIHGRPGVTLAEVLVVIGIVAVLVSILLPAVSAVRRHARQVTCTGNLRQWAAAGVTYAAGHDGFLPRRGQGQQPTTQIDRPDDWFNALPAALNGQPFSQLVAAGQAPRVGGGSVWVCPEATEPAAGAYLFTYAMNMRLSTWLGPDPDRIAAVGDPSTLAFMADAPGGYCAVLPAAADYSPVARHHGNVNVAFLDGHVASFAGAYVGCGVGDPHRPDVRWVVPNSPWLGPQP